MMRGGVAVIVRMLSDCATGNQKRRNKQ